MMAGQVLKVMYGKTLRETKRVRLLYWKEDQLTCVILSTEADWKSGVKYKSIWSIQTVGPQLGRRQA